MKGMFFMAQAVYPAMAERGRGCIINVASQRGLKGAPNSTPYCAAKAAIIGFTRALACEAAPKGVRVNAVAPGPIVTDLPPRWSRPIGKPSSMRCRWHRLGRPEEIAATALLLAARMARSMSAPHCLRTVAISCIDRAEPPIANF